MINDHTLLSCLDVKLTLFFGFCANDLAHQDLRLRLEAVLCFEKMPGAERLQSYRQKPGSKFLSDLLFV